MNLPQAPEESLPEKIARFRPLECILATPQGIDYLAQDPATDSEVVIRSFLGEFADPEATVASARAAQGLDHPHIVPLIECGVDQGHPFLVYPYVPGVTLKERLDPGRPLPPAKILYLLEQCLEALQYAHDRGLLHLSLNPRAIIIDNGEQARILDFGIAAVMARADTTQRGGGVCYTAPECLNDGAGGPTSDLFSLSVIFHEMLTGKPLFAAQNPMAVAYKILHEVILPASTLNKEVDHDLDAIVQKGLARDEGERYRSPEEMRRALVAYRQGEAISGAAPAGARGPTTLHPNPLGPTTLNPLGPTTLNPAGTPAVEGLLRRIRQRPDLPVLGARLDEIAHRLSSGERLPLLELARPLGKEYALTLKMLRQASVSGTAAARGGIGTLTKAISMIGLEGTRQALQGVPRLEEVEPPPRAEALRAAQLGAQLAGRLTRNLVGRRYPDPEEAVMAGQLHGLGRHLLLWAFPEGHEEIQRLMKARGISAAIAERQVLGATAAELGLAVAREWNLPRRLQAAMEPTAPRPPQHEAGSPEEWLSVCAALANELVAAMGHEGRGDPRREIAEAAARYRPALKLAAPAMAQIVVDTVTEWMESLDEVESGLAQASPLVRLCLARVRILTGGEVAADSGGGPAAAREAATAGEAVPTTRLGALLQGVLAAETDLLGETGLNDLLARLIQAFHRSGGFERVLLCVRNPRQNAMQARIGFGEGIDTLLPRFGFPIDESSPDHFNEALVRRREIWIADGADPAARERIPPWCRTLCAPSALFLAPIEVRGKPIGLLYADSSLPLPPPSGEERLSISVLVKLAAIAIKYRN
jgi:serine/threonine protein kinase